MKKTTLMLAAIAMALSVGAGAMAQDAGPQGGAPQERQGRPGGERKGPGRGMGMRHKIQQEVLAQMTLTDAQKKKIAELDKQTMEAGKKLMEEARAARQASGAEKGTPPSQAEKEKWGKAMRELGKKHNESLMKILTKEQQAQYRELSMAKMKELREQREKQGEGKQRRGQQPPPNA